MTCSEFRFLFVHLLKEQPPASFPAEEYRRHFVTCLPCQVILSLREVENAITDYSGTQPSRLSSGRIHRLVRRARRKATMQKVLLPVAACAIVLLVAASAIALLAPDKPDRMDESGITLQAELPPASPCDFGNALASEGFEFVSGETFRSNNSLFFVFTRTNAGADQYGFVRKVVLSGFHETFPHAPQLTISITDQDGQSLLMVLVLRTDLADASFNSSRESNATFLRQFTVLLDKDGLTKLQGE